MAADRADAAGRDAGDLPRRPPQPLLVYRRGSAEPLGAGALDAGLLPGPPTPRDLGLGTRTMTRLGPERAGETPTESGQKQGSRLKNLNSRGVLPRQAGGGRSDRRLIWFDDLRSPLAR